MDWTGLDWTGLDWTTKTRTSKSRTSKTRTSKYSMPHKFSVGVKFICHLRATLELTILLQNPDCTFE